MSARTERVGATRTRPAARSDRVRDTGFGPRYEVEGELRVPDNRRPCVRTVWQVDEGQTAARLITAYQLEADV